MTYEWHTKSVLRVVLSYLCLIQTEYKKFPICLVLILSDYIVRDIYHSVWYIPYYYTLSNIHHRHHQQFPGSHDNLAICHDAESFITPAGFVEYSPAAIMGCLENNVM